MAYFERIRDVVTGPLADTTMQQRLAAGWQLVSLQWRRELPGDAPHHETVFDEEIPYGLRISEDCSRLEVDPSEDQALKLMMDLLVQDFPYSSVASTLNEGGFRTREGKPWTRVAVFNMHPRLIEVGPRMFAETERKGPRQNG